MLVPGSRSIGGLDLGYLPPMRSPLRVLWLIKGLGPGGAEQLLVNHARAAASSNVEYTAAFLVPWKDHLVGALEAADVRTFCLDSSKPYDLRWLYRLRALVKEEQIDVVHGHSPLVSSMWRLVRQTMPATSRPRSVFTEHNEWPRHAKATQRLNRATIGLEDAVLAVSEGVRETMPTSLDVEVLHHGIHLDSVSAAAAERQSVREELGLDEGTVAVGTVANFRKEKAHEVLLAAARRVVDGGHDVRFFLVGQGPLEAEIRAQIADLDLHRHVIVLGFRPDAHRVMAGLDIMALSSRHEGLPVVLMEAFALGLPVVATTVGGIPEATGGGMAASLVPPGNEVDLARALTELVVDPAQRSALGAAALDRAAFFDVHRSVARLEALYRSAASRN